MTDTNGEIKIEKGVKIPNKRYHYGRGKWQSVVKKMKVNDSFIVRKDLQSAVWRAGQSVGINILTRTLDDNTIRIWRIK